VVSVHSNVNKHLEYAGRELCNLKKYRDWLRKAVIYFAIACVPQSLESGGGWFKLSFKIWGALSPCQEGRGNRGMEKIT